MIELSDHGRVPRKMDQQIIAQSSRDQTAVMIIYALRKHGLHRPLMNSAALRGYLLYDLKQTVEPVFHDRFRHVVFQQGGRRSGAL